MPALYGVGLTYLLQRAVRGPQSVDNVESTFFLCPYELLVCRKMVRMFIGIDVHPRP